MGREGGIKHKASTPSFLSSSSATAIAAADAFIFVCIFLLPCTAKSMAKHFTTQQGLEQNFSNTQPQDYYNDEAEDMSEEEDEEEYNLEHDV